MESGGGSGYLPPEPAGPEPDLGGAPRREPPPEQPDQQPGGGWVPPPGQQPPPPGQQPPPQGGWQPPPQGGWQPQQGWQPQPWAQPQAPAEPDNGAAVAGFVTSVVSGALLLISFGFLGVVTMIAAPFGIHYSRKGKRAVAEGKTRKHAGLAQAGLVIGIVTLVLSILAVAIAIAFIIAIATDDEFRREFEDRNDGFDSTSLSVGLALTQAAVRLVA